MPSQKSGSKKPKDTLHSLKEKYIQAHLDGNKNLKKFYGDMIKAKGGELPTLPK
jgi:hypothetical protein